MASIISQTFADGDDQALQMANEEWGRLLAIGDDWTRLRLGVMCNMTPNSSENILSGSLRLGFSTGAADHVGGNNAALWYGCLFGGQTTALTGGTWTYNAGSGNPYFTGAGIGRVKVLNGVISGGSASGGARIVTNSGSTARRSIFVVELEKDAGSMDVRAAAHTGGATNRDFTLNQFRLAMADPTALAVGLGVDGVAMSNFGETSFSNYATDEAAEGTVKAAHVGWNKDVLNFLRIFAIEVYRHA